LGLDVFERSLERTKKSLYLRVGEPEPKAKRETKQKEGSGSEEPVGGEMKEQGITG